MTLYEVKMYIFQITVSSIRAKRITLENFNDDDVVWLACSSENMIKCITFTGFSKKYFI